MHTYVHSLFVLISLNVGFVWGACNLNYSDSAKPCPSSGTTLLDDTYPASAYVISNTPANPKAAGEKTVADFIFKVMEAHNFSPDGPSFMISGRFIPGWTYVRDEVNKRIAESNGKIPKSASEKLVLVETQDWTWSQDYFESFYNPETGKPVLRRMESYQPKEFYSNTPENMMKEASAKCGVEVGDKLATDHNQFVQDGSGKSFSGGEMGGNIEGLPGGLCLIGDNASVKFGSQFCGKPENVLQIDVSWLTVGHVDEVFKVVPTNIPGVPSECSFSLMFASPKKAMELLSRPSSLMHPLFSGEILPDGTSAEELERFRELRSAMRVGKMFCEILNNRIIPNRSNTKEGTSKPSGASRAYIILESLIPSAYASGSSCAVDSITNSEFLEVMKQPEFKDYNDMIQKVMDENKKKIISQILTRLPQCKKYLNVVDVPNLFYGTPAVDEKGVKSLPKPGDASSFLPNPTNSVIANKTVIFSDPQNSVFRDYLQEEMKKKGIGASFVDTWEFAHIGDGNLHCATHSIPYCAPIQKSQGGVP